MRLRFACVVGRRRRRASAPQRKETSDDGDLAAYRTTVDAVGDRRRCVDVDGCHQDQALRQALAEYDDHFVYETSVTVTSGGVPDLSSVDALRTFLP